MTQEASKQRCQTRVRIMEYMMANSGKRFHLDKVAHNMGLSPQLVRHEAGLLASAGYLNKFTSVNGGTKLEYQWTDRCKPFPFDDPIHALSGKGDLKGLKVWRVHPSALKNVTKDRLDEICAKYEPVEVY